MPVNTSFTGKEVGTSGTEAPYFLYPGGEIPDLGQLVPKDFNNSIWGYLKFRSYEITHHYQQ